MPYYNFAAWKEAQKSDTDLKRTYAQLVSGTRPGKKERNLKAVRANRINFRVWSANP